MFSALIRRDTGELALFLYYVGTLLEGVCLQAWEKVLSRTHHVAP